MKNFFKVPTKEFFKGIRYMEAKNYTEAIICFENCKAYKHLTMAYAKLGRFDIALDLADTYQFYKLGASLAKHIGDQNQVAYFYTFFNPKLAARLYRDLKCYYNAGYCYLLIGDTLNAIDMFMRCPDKLKRIQGLREVTDYARVLYLKKDYFSAFRLFIALDDFYSALECAYQLKEDSLIASCKVLLGQIAISKQDFNLAAQCLEEISPKKASFYYAKAGEIDLQIELLLKQQAYQQAVQICCYHNDLNKAYEIASCYDPSLLSS